MAKPKKRRKKPSGHRPPVTAQDPRAELRPLVEALEAGTAADGPTWGQIHKLLLASPIDKTAVGHMIARRDVPALKRLLDAESLEDFDPDAEVETSGDTLTEFDAEEKRKAMRAFRRKLKYARLDDESRLGVGPMSGGKSSEISAIIPPSEFEREIWRALVRDGVLRDMKQGFYELTDGS